jgi:hypothetical protein
MGSNKNQDICIEYLTTYLRGEVAGGHAGGGTDTIGFLLEKEGVIGFLPSSSAKSGVSAASLSMAPRMLALMGSSIGPNMVFLVMMYQWVHDDGNGENGKQ